MATTLSILQVRHSSLDSEDLSSILFQKMPSKTQKKQKIVDPKQPVGFQAAYFGLNVCTN